MSQHDGVVQDQDGGSFLTDLDAFIEAVLSRQSGTSNPSVVYPYEQFVRTDRGAGYRTKSSGSGELIDFCAQDTVLVTNSGASKTLIEGDHGRTYEHTYNSGVITLNLPTPNSRMDGWFSWHRPTGNEIDVVAPSGYINQTGVATQRIPRDMPFGVGCDGTNYFLLGVDPRDFHQTLTDAANVDWDMSKGHIATLTAAGNRTFNAPTKLRRGTFVLMHVQDATGSRTPTLNALFKFRSGYTPSWSTAANARDIIGGVCDGTSLYCGDVQKGY